MGETKPRIEWIDVYKGLAIALVVLGHATGKFNMYIYQFHVAAFFFISGYVASFDKTNLLSDIYKKIMTLMLPLLTMVVIYAVLIDILKRIGLVTTLGLDSEAIGIIKPVINFFRSGSAFSLLGTSWFLWVLFGASIISHLVYKISMQNRWAYAVFVMLIYFWGFYRMKKGIVLPYYLDIALVAQGYYGMGYMAKTISQIKPIKIFDNQVFIVILFCATSIAMYNMNAISQNLGLMDLASHTVYSLWWNTIAVLNGAIWLYSFSIIIVKLPFLRVLKDGLIALGKQTMGIMLLHFTFFRVVAAALYAVGLADKDELKLLTPSQNIGNSYWWLYLTISIVGSFFLWKALISVPVLKQLLGADRKFVTKNLNCQAVEKLSETYNTLVLSLKNNAIGMIPFLVLILMLVSEMFVPKGLAAGTENQEMIDGLPPISGEYIIAFPYDGNEVVFGDGWHLQQESETYRWTGRQAHFYANLTDQQLIRIIGYIPEGFDINRVDLYLNDNYITGIDVGQGQQFVIEGGIEGAVISNATNSFEIVFDNEHVPSETDADQRTLSALFSSIEIM